MSNILNYLIDLNFHVDFYAGSNETKTVNYVVAYDELT